MVGALAFGALAGGLVLMIAWSGPSGGATGRLILAGIAVSALFGAGTTSLMVAYSDRVQSAVLWMAGGLSSDGWSGMRVAWPYFAVGFVVAAVLSRPLDRLALGDDVAESLGVRPRLIRLAAVSAAALLASAAAALVGLLGFLGLVIPHLVRLAGGTASHRFVMGASALVGAALLLAGDSRLTAKIGKATVTVLTIDGAKRKLNATTGSIALRGATVRLTVAGAAALRRALKVKRLSPGVLGTLTVDAKRRSMTTGGSTTGDTTTPGGTTTTPGGTSTTPGPNTPVDLGGPAPLARPATAVDISAATIT